MTHDELKLIILDYMRDCFNVEFIGNIKIEDLFPQGYKVSLFLNNDYYPLVIMADLPDEEFVAFIKEELRSRKLHRTEHYATYKLPRCYDKALSMPNVSIIRRLANNKPEIIKTREEIESQVIDDEWIGYILEFNGLGDYYDNIAYYIVI